MAERTINKLEGRARAEIKIPGDKSISHRSIIFGSIAKGETHVEGFLNGEDCLCTMQAFQALGVDIDYNEENKTLDICGAGMENFIKPSKAIYLGNSGTAMRLLAGLFSGLNFSTTLTGDESLSGRPMKRVIDPLALMGAEIDSNDGKAPLLINPNEEKFKLKGIEYNSKIASAQVKSAVLLAGLNADGLTTVSEPHKSRDHTERMLEYFGAQVMSTGTSVSLLGKDSLKMMSGREIQVPGDISSAAFYMVAGAILSDAQLKVLKVGINPTRDGIIEVLDKMNVDHDIYQSENYGFEPVADIMVRSSNPQAMVIDGEIIPRLIDEIPVISILAAQAEGQTIIKDAAELKVKESNRIRSTVNMLKALGVEVEETDDGMIIEGRNTKPFDPDLDEVVIDSHGDHRLAMSAAIAALHCTKPVRILKTEFVNTSFPDFFDILDNIKEKALVNAQN